MADVNEHSSWAADLDRLEQKMRQLHARPGLGTLALGVAEWDRQLWRLGRAWLAANPFDDTDASHRTTDVYIATQVYPIGGHTALIGDFVRALGRPAHLVLTGLGADPHSTVSDATQTRLGLTESQISVLPGPTAFERLQQLFSVLQQLRPARLFLFQHPHDPLASVVAQPEIARRRVLVHHADATPSFAMHVPGIRLVDLSAPAAAMSRALGLCSAYLPLTSPDPGTRRATFLQREKLVTASSGSPHKFATPYAMGYAETVGVILRATAGWHVHIGPLFDEARAEVAHEMERAAVPVDRFVYVPWAASVASALWEHQCDVYFASFPIDGARTKIEAMAAGLPYLGHSKYPHCAETRATASDGGLRWHAWDDLAETLQRLADPSVLQQYSAIVRRTYENRHHPRVFAEALTKIVDGVDRPHVPDPEVERRAVSLLMRSLITTARAEIG